MALTLLAISLVLAACGGGGGGGTGGDGQTVTLLGRVLWIETGGAPEPLASVQAEQASVSTDPIDGSFSLDAPAGTQQVTVTYQPAAASSPVVATFGFPSATSTTDLGDLYIGPQTVALTGRVVDSTSGQPIVNAQLEIAGRSATAGSDGNFTIQNVAYSDQALAVFLGLSGTVSAEGYFSRDFNPPGAPSNGVVELGDVPLTPTGTSTPPGLPFNVAGSVTPVNRGAGATVTLSNGTTSRQTTADNSGRYELWVPAGTYTLTAVNGSFNGSAAVTVVQVDQIVTQNVEIN
ncbi:MAG: hypothetical protein ACOCX1_03280 [Fimbriimonadaceae bacterium]